MRITIIGGGKVGLSLARSLIGENHEVTLVDTNDQVIDRAGNSLDIICYTGNGASFAALKDLEIENCDLVIAVTGSDELNLLACHAAHKLGARHTIARVRGPEYTEQLYQLKRDLGLSMFINPEKAAAEEIERILRFPSASRVELFARGHVELVSCRLPAGNVLDNQLLRDLSSKFGIKVLICAVDRQGELFIPGGNFLLKAGDELYLTGAPTDMAEAFRRIGLQTEPVKSVMITGGGAVTYYLASLLEDRHVRVKIVERDRDVAETLAEKLPDTVVIHADATDHEVLLEEGLEKNNAFVSLTGLDEGNILSALNARQHEVSKVIAKVNSDNLQKLARTLGIETVISPKLVVTNQILRYVRALDDSSHEDNILSLYKILDGRAEVLEFAAENAIPNLTDIPLSRLKLRRNVLIACIVRDGKIIVPGGNDMIKAGDGVLVVSAGGMILNLIDILENP